MGADFADDKTTPTVRDGVKTDVFVNEKSGKIKKMIDK